MLYTKQNAKSRSIERLTVLLLMCHVHVYTRRERESERKSKSVCSNSKYPLCCSALLCFGLCIQFVLLQKNRRNEMSIDFVAKGKLSFRGIERLDT